MPNQGLELSYAVRGSVVCKYVGQLLAVVAALTLLPLCAALCFGDVNLTMRYALVIVVLGGTGTVMGRLRCPAPMQKNEALVVVASVFLLVPLVMTYPLMKAGLGFADAWFEAVSAVTTTGLSTATTVQGKPQTFLFARAWMQWYGGLGIVVLSLVLAIQPGLAAKRLAATDLEQDDLVGGTKAHARRILWVYLALTVIGVLVLWLLGIELFAAVEHILAAVSTGGFSGSDESLAALGGYAVQITVILFCLGGAVPLTLYHRAYRKGWREVRAEAQLWIMLGSAGVIGLLLVGFLWIARGMPWYVAMHHGMLSALSAQTTAGFSTFDVSGLPAAAKLLLILSMVSGGGVGSTAGGMKVLRLIVLLRLLQATLVRTSLPAHAVFEPRLGHQRLEPEEIQEALGIVLLFITIIVVSWLAFVAMGFDPVDSLFEVVSATATVGLSTGISQAGLPTLLKGVLCFDMLMGRLELLALLVMVYPRTWLGRRVRVS